MFKVQAASQGAGQIRPVNSGKLFVECKTSIAFLKSFSFVVLCYSARFLNRAKLGIVLNEIVLTRGNENLIVSTW